MTKQVININAPKDLIGIGTSANDRKGDSLRAAFTKVNDAIDKIDANFTELYAATGADIQIPVQANNGGKFLTTNGTTLSWDTVNPGSDQTLNVGDNVQFGEIRQDNARLVASSTSIVAGSTSVVFSMPTWCTSAKLVIKVECRLDVGSIDHTQISEATIAATYNTNDDPVMSVFGVVHTSPTPIATFTINRTGLNGSGNIEVSTTNTQTINSMYVSVHAVQFGSTFD